MTVELSPVQQQIVDAEATTIAVEACAGSGKTRVLAERAKRLASEGRSVLVVAFTRSAVDELRHRIADPRVEVMTVHALAHRIATANLGGRPLWVATQGELDDTIDAARRGLGYEKKCSLKGIEAALRERPEESGYAVLVANEVRLRLAESNRIDFDGLVQRARAAILERQWVAPWTDVLLDEAQDLHRGLWDLLDAIATATPQVRRFAVGDPRQAIFGFLGGARDRFEAFCELADVFVAMVENYRSAEAVVACANEIATVVHSDGIMVAQRHGGSVFHSCLPVEDFVRDALESGEDSLAVIARTNRELDEIGQRLAGERIDYARIPTMRAGTEKTARVIAWIRCLANPNDEVAARTFAGRDEAQLRLIQVAIAGGLPPACWVREHRLEPTTVEEAAELARFSATVAAGWTAADYLDAWTRQEVLDADLGAVRDAKVVLATAHTAKGREWRSVIVRIGGFVRGQGDADRALYVAVTRAKDALILSS